MLALILPIPYVYYAECNNLEIFVIKYKLKWKDQVFYLII